MDNHVTCLLIADTGVGKCEFGNRYLRAKRFKPNDSPYPVTLDPETLSTVIDGMTRYDNVIDTEGNCDGNSTSSEQIQKLKLFIKQWKLGVNAVWIVLNEWS
jgi:hypothetical protein